MCTGLFFFFLYVSVSVCVVGLVERIIQQPAHKRGGHGEDNCLCTHPPASFSTLVSVYLQLSFILEPALVQPSVLAAAGYPHLSDSHGERDFLREIREAVCTI